MNKCGGCGAVCFAYEDMEDFCTCDMDCCGYCGFPDEACDCDDDFIDSIDFP